MKNESSSILLGRYEKGKLLGHGTFAKVYHARNIETNESVAIKVIDKERILKGGLNALITREISILRRVRHPNIVCLHEVMATRSKIYFVMEFVRGGELFKKIAKGRLMEDEARRYFQQLISAVGFCHARGVYHRDLKPENLLVDEDGNLKVSDFGLSVGSEQLRPDGLFHTLCGTPAYVAPEILSGKGYNAATADVWSCGVVLFVLTAGFLPFHDQNIMAMYRKIYRGEFLCPKWISGGLRRLLSRMLDTNPLTRIKIPDLMQNRWFKKDFNPVSSNFIDEQGCLAGNNMEESFGFGQEMTKLNAFDIISFSSGFDLSPLFQEGELGRRRFVSEQSVAQIVDRLEEMGKVVSFEVRTKGWKVDMEESADEAVGLQISTEMFELTPELAMVEVRMKGGSIGNFEGFCEKELRPRLQKAYSI